VTFDSRPPGDDEKKHDGDAAGNNGALSSRSPSAHSDVFEAVMTGLAEDGGGSGGPQYASHYEHASALLRFPNLSLKACLFGFQGFLFESLVLLRRDDRTAVEAVVGSIGLLVCTAFLVISHMWGTMAGREESFIDSTYVAYLHVFEKVPQGLRYAFLPAGFWRGTHLFVRRFGALFEAFETKHVRWVASVHLWRAVIISVLSAIKPAHVSGCKAVYVTLAVVFFAFGLLFLITRPHRAPFDDFTCITLNLCTGLLALSIGASIETIDTTALYLYIVYAALASVVVSVALFVAETVFLRQRELRAQGLDGPTAHAAVDDEDEANGDTNDISGDEGRTSSDLRHEPTEAVVADEQPCQEDADTAGSHADDHLPPEVFEDAIHVTDFDDL